ncbi:monovalent cation/H+ antiporter subunit D [Kerstersia gyiorum]|uniref:monovalent cation/H+ antiporter subunit D n=1 Tax=Kerstersia gyiorum TaxID=206506 RepID=UPI00209FDE96|nr:monovalent cation/H+ antiporter subunit D [Kerstersia gyiorum]MCP1634854.1 multicomponent K+:H+ antiporter subunit D [Kerstersia gyiorum]MCP1683993.1 multicomponent K+:H+ antiporter subunit D [Kerstersia gyiorum]MCP1719651.1 multicomponent K+:H+ antiporter subunit D [Kerstersia gyiorum]MCW2186932.1 multicomponent K+:H+ antiporter subunit D [Kerstersia gyiorum]
MSGLVSHLVILPIVLPMVAGAAMLLLNDTRKEERRRISLISTALVLLVAVVMLGLAAFQDQSWVLTYRPANWAPPFGIVLVADRLSVLMLVVTAALALASMLAALQRWDKAGVHFHPLFQFQLMGLNGAFLTGDIFNLFVFFEILLAASYGLLLHGSGQARVKAGLHYIAINLVGSSLFLIGATLIYGSVGTLNMAELATLAGKLDDKALAMFQSGAAILGCAFLIKAAAWPMNFWLVPAYIAAVPPVGALFAIMTKVGAYAVLRLRSLLASQENQQDFTSFASTEVFAVGILTIVVAGAGLLVSQDMRRQAAYSVIVSAGTLLACIGFGNMQIIAPALYYLISSTFAVGAMFLLVDLIERNRPFGADVLALSLEAFGVPDSSQGDTEQADTVVGITVPAALAVLGGCFVFCALIVAGLPPLSGFIAKFGMFAAALGDSGTNEPVTGRAWVFLTVVLLSGLAAIVSLSRVGIRTFWVVERQRVRLSLADIAPVLWLLGLCVLMVVFAGPLLSYLEQTVQYLSVPTGYTDAVLGVAAGGAQ